MINSITKEAWEKFKPQENPFLTGAFFKALSQSGCIGQEAGWVPKIFVNTNQDAALYTFIKNHSRGEYIFDWAWAEAYARYGIAYYPKLTSLVPFTPVTSNHFLMPNFDASQASELLKQYGDFYQEGPFSSSHFLFLKQEEIAVFEAEKYMIRESMQYHFSNENYSDFDDFLNQLKGRKAKQIRQERKHPGFKFIQYTGDSLTIQHAKNMYQFYISTIENKNSLDYLNEEFFVIVFQTMKKNILYVEAQKDESAIAGSLFFFDHKKLYGRYWGSNTYFQNLHFELCYYQGIDFCLSHNLEVFEAGAQGEHKISRGFRPTRTYSAHKLKNDMFQSAVEAFIKEEKVYINNGLNELTKSLPFKFS